METPPINKKVCIVKDDFQAILQQTRHSVADLAAPKSDTETHPVKKPSSSLWFAETYTVGLTGCV